MALSTLGNASCEILFLKSRDVYKDNTNRLNSYDICKAAANVVMERNIEGAQLIRGVWKIYVKNIASKIDLLQQGMVIRGIAVTLHEANPYTSQKDDSPVEKVTIKDLPLNVGNDTIQNCLKDQHGLILKSLVMYSKVRDESGQYTNFKNGDRYVYVLAPIQPALPNNGKIDNHSCRFVHESQEKYCKSCRSFGHKTLANECPAKGNPDRILAFKSYTHVLSNHYPCKLYMYGESFDSAEHAYLWRKAKSLGCDATADKIQSAKHAGEAKKIAINELKSDDNTKWMEISLDVMAEIQETKADQCEPFRRALLESGTKVLAEATNDSFWATGMSPYLTTNTKEEFWSGQNMLGEVQMNLRKTLLRQQSNIVQNTATDANAETVDTNTTDNIDLSTGQSTTEDARESSDDENNKDETEEHIDTDISPNKSLLAKMGSAFFRTNQAKSNTQTNEKKDQKSIRKYFPAKDHERKKRPKETPSPLKENKRAKEENNGSSPFVMVDKVAMVNERSNHPPKVMA